MVSSNISENNEISFEKASLEVREQFLENLELHLRSDVRVGTSLSGGLDSSSIVCGMRYSSKHEY